MTVPRLDLELLGPVPLTATLGRSELEVAAALVLLCMQELEVPWGEALPREKFQRWLTTSPHERLREWQRNPFLRPDIPGLIALGWAQWADQPASERVWHDALLLTPKTREAVARYLTPDSR